DGTINISAPGVLGNDSDPDNDPLTSVLVSSTQNGTLVFNSNGSFTYTPNGKFHGTDSFSYKGNDGDLDSNIAIVTITVNAVNHAPIAVNDSYSVDEDGTLNISETGVLGNDTDPDNNPLTTVLVTSTQNG